MRGNRPPWLPFQFSRARPRSLQPALRLTMFNAAKDALSSRAAQSWANNLIARYGKILDLKIDSRRKTVEVSCQLDGESTPIVVRIEKYVVENDGDKKFITASGFTCTRPWLQNLLTDFGHRQRIELPAWAAAAL